MIEGGLKVVPRYGARDNRVHVWFGDLNILFPTFNDYVDLAVCNGGLYSQKFSDPMPKDRFMWLQTIVQFIYALEHIKNKGTIVMLLHNYCDYKTILIMLLLREISEPGLYNPPLLHRFGEHFYGLAVGVDLNSPSLHLVKQTLQEALYNVRNLAIRDWRPSFLRKEIDAFLETGGEMVASSGEVLWESQIVILERLLESVAPSSPLVSDAVKSERSPSPNASVEYEPPEDGEI